MQRGPLIKQKLRLLQKLSGTLTISWRLGQGPGLGEREDSGNSVKPKVGNAVLSGFCCYVVTLNMTISHLFYSSITCS